MMEQLQYINVDDIIPNRFQPRKKFEETDLNELAESIKQHGIIQPLVLRRLGNKFEIIAGERRYKAANIVGLKQVPSIVMDLDDRTSAEIALAENIQRKDLTAIEKAKSYKQILGLGQITQEELAKKMGKSQPAVSNTLRLLDLTEEVQNALLQNRISERHARSLLALKDPELQKQMLNEIINNRMTVRETDLAIKEMLSNHHEDNEVNKKEENKESEEIIDFSNDNDISNNKQKNVEIIDDAQNIENNEKEIPEFDQIDINKEDKKSFLNNYVNLDNEAANMNFGTENTNTNFNNFIDIPKDTPNLNINKEKEEKEVSETPMISEPVNENNNYNNNENMNNNIPNNQIPQNQEMMYPNNNMMPPQGNMYPPFQGQPMPYQDQGYNQYQPGMSGPMPNMYPNNNMMPPQGNMYPPFQGQPMPYQDQGYNQYQPGMNGPMPNMYPNNNMMPPTPEENTLNSQNNGGTIYPSNPEVQDSNNVLESNQDVAPQAIIMQHDITGAVAVIRNTVMNLQNNGYMIDISEDDLSNAYVINIKLEK